MDKLSKVITPEEDCLDNVPDNMPVAGLVSIAMFAEVVLSLVQRLSKASLSSIVRDGVMIVFSTVLVGC